VTEYSYTIFGLSFRSQLELPEFEITPAEKADISIRFGNTPDHLNNISSSGILYEAGTDAFLLKLPHIGNYLVINGNEIIIHPRPEASSEEIRLFLLGSVLGALLFQRGFLPIHGSSVKIDEKAVIIIGNSAAGKSTLAASLNQDGHSLISDDLSAISMNKSGHCVILPGIPFVKLWQDTQSLLFPNGSFDRVRPQIKKFRVPVHNRPGENEEIEINAIIRLATKNSPGYNIQEIKGAKKMNTLRDHVFRDQLIKGLGMPEYHFRMLSDLSNQISLFHLERPSVPLELERLKEIVINSATEH